MWTPRLVDDGAQVDSLLDQVTGPLSSFTADGAYDQDGVYAAVAERHPVREAAAAYAEKHSRKQEAA